MNLLRNVLSLFEPRERLRAGLLLGALVLAAGLETVGIGLVLPFVAIVLDGGAATQPAWAERLRELVGGADHAAFVIRCGLALLAFHVVKNTILGVVTYARHRFVFGVMERTSARLMRAYLAAPYAFHLRRSSAELQRNVTANVPLAFNWVVAHTFVLASDALATLLLSVLLVALAPLGSMVSLGVLVGVALLYSRGARARTRDLGEEEQRALGQMIKWVNQSVGAFKETRVRGAERFFLARFAKESAEYARARRLLEVASDAPRLVLETAAVAAVVLILVVSILAGTDTAALVPLVALFAAAAFRLLPAFTRIVRSLHLVKHYRPALDAVLEDLSALESAPAALVEVPVAGPPAPRLARGIELSDVHFRYQGERAPVLCGVSLEIPRGASVALVGPSGCGKTTVVDLILGLVAPTSGAVLADGRSIRADLAAWRRRFGYVPQDVYILDDTIRRNVAFGVEDDQIDDAAVRNALRAARLDELVDGLPGGLDHEAGERGVRLSGGERQRLGIARALYHDPELLVLDEATSALDPETERGIAATTLGLAGRRTVVVVAHRVSTVEGCDRIYLLQDGRLEAQGSFGELLRTSASFRRLVQVG